MRILRLGATAAVLAAARIGTLAAEEAEGVPLEAQEGGGGMPQLDPTHFASQIFWLAVTFGVFLLIVWRVVLPKIAAVLEQRQGRISADLEKAALLRDDAETVLAEYEKATAEGRAKAQAVLRETQEELAAEAARRHEELAKVLAGQVREAEERIAGERDAAVDSIRDVAVELSQIATKRLVGSEVDAKAAAKAVDGVMKERG